MGSCRFLLWRAVAVLYTHTHNTQCRKQLNMSRVFSWEYFSFLKIDEAAAYKEVAIIPLLVVVLFVVWMKLVRGENSVLAEKKDKTKDGIDIVAAYQDALANEMDSGTEMDSQNEDEGEKDDAEKKDD